MIQHIVMFRLEGDYGDAALRFKKAIEELPGKIDGLISAHVYIDNRDTESNWTLALTSEVRDAAALSAYATHPAHLACVAIIKPHIAARACVDAR